MTETITTEPAEGSNVPAARPKVARRLPNKKSLLKQLAYWARWRVMAARIMYLRNFVKMDIDQDVRISFKAHLDFTNPKGVHIAQGTLVAFRAVILTHDMSRVLSTDTYVGRNCFIGAHSIIMPGVRVGDGCIVASGSVVTRDVPPNSIVAGNPARVVKSDIRTLKWGVLEESYAEALELAEAAITKL